MQHRIALFTQALKLHINLQLICNIFITHKLQKTNAY